jgi:histidinol-phosphate/aromatic aminotransferase/cobyric acid decarboxylase-like protein
MLDFCYLVNPYFPSPQMNAELKSYFDVLLTEYPSGLNAQNLLAAKLFNLDEARVLAGNGAAELIRGLSRILSGSIGVIYPTFNEYAESFLQNESIRLAAYTPENFSYHKDDLIAFSAECDALVLINPDNPSGHYICRDDVLAVAAYFRTQNKLLRVVC